MRIAPSGAGRLFSALFYRNLRIYSYLFVIILNKAWLFENKFVSLHWVLIIGSMQDNNNEKKVLTLIIKQKYFDAILQGRKVQEFREIRPTNERKYVLLDEKGYAILDDNQNCIPVKYDAIRFYVGYAKDRDTALVEVKSAFTQVIVDDKGNPITYDYEGEEYWAEQVVYNLGRILEHNIREQSRRM